MALAPNDPRLRAAAPPKQDSLSDILLDRVSPKAKAEAAKKLPSKDRVAALSDILLQGSRSGQFPSPPKPIPIPVDERFETTPFGTPSVTQGGLTAFNTYGDIAGIPSKRLSGLRSTFVREQYYERTADGLVNAISNHDYAGFRRVLPDVDADEFDSYFSKRYASIAKMRKELAGLPGKYGRFASQAFDEIDGLTKFAILSDRTITNDQVGLVLGAGVVDKVKAKVMSDVSDIEENDTGLWNRVQDVLAFRLPSSNLAEQLVLGVGQPIADKLFPDVYDEKAAVALAEMFEMKDIEKARSIINRAGGPQKWFDEHILGSAPMKLFTVISEAPARALDALAVQIAEGVNEVMGPQPGLRGGQVYSDVRTLGQLIAYPLKDTEIAFNVMSGTADAMKLFTFDSFAMFGASMRGMQAARGLGRIEDIRGLERGIKSRPVAKFIREVGNSPQSARDIGQMRRHKSNYGWDMDESVLTELYLHGDSPQAVEGIVRKGAIEGTIRKLPYRSWHAPIRDFAEGTKRALNKEGDVKKPDVRVSRLLRGPFRMTWGSWMPLDLDRAVNPMQTIQRQADFLFGSRSQGDNAAKIANEYVTRWSLAEKNGERLDIMAEMHEVGFRSLLRREADKILGKGRSNVADDEIEAAIERLRQNYPHSITGKRAVIDAYGGEIVPRPGESVPDKGLGWYHTSSYDEALAMRREFIKTILPYAKGTKESMARFRLAMAGMDQFVASKLTNPMKTIWTSTPKTGLRSGIDEFLTINADPVVAREMRRLVTEKFSDTFHQLPFYSAKTKQTRRLKGVLARQDHPLPLRMHMGANLHLEQHIPPVIRNAEKALLDEVQEIAPFLIDQRVAKTDAAYIESWANEINNVLLRDPVATTLINRLGVGGRLDEAQGAARAWLRDTPEGLAHLEAMGGKSFDVALPTPELVAERNKLIDDIIDDVLGEIYQTVGGDKGWQALLPTLQGALQSGKRVDFDTLHHWQMNGIGPDELIANVRMENLTLEEMVKAGLGTRANVKRLKGQVKKTTAESLKEISDSSITDIIKRGMGGAFRLGATMADRYVRAQGFQAWKNVEAQRLVHVSADAVKHGFSGMSAEVIEDMAHKFAFEKMMRFENPIEKSRVDSFMRNIVLFTYNQANFIKRWGRVLVRNPGYASRARMMVGGMEDLGFIEKDENGNLTLQIPISTDFYKWVLTHNQKDRPKNFWGPRFSLGFSPESEGLGALYQGPFRAFGNIAIPPGMPFSTSVAPGFAPLATFLVAGFTSDIPQLEGIRSIILGGYENWSKAPGSRLGDNLLASIAPGYIKSLSRALMGDQADRALAGSFIDLLAYGEMSGKITDAFDDKEWETTFGHNLFTLARGLAVFKAITQFAFPYAMASPVFVEAAEDYRKLLNTMPPEEAKKKFLDAQHGKGWPIIVAMTQKGEVEVRPNEFKAPRFLLAPTKTAEKFFLENQDFFERYPDIAGLFTYKATDSFEQTPFRRQMLRGQRVGRDLESLQAAMTLEAAQAVYYDEVLPQVHAKVASGEYTEDDAADVTRQARAAINDSYPGFEGWHEGGQGRSYERRKAIEDIIKAVNDPTVSKMKDVEPLRLFMQEYNDSLQQLRAETGIPNAMLGGRVATRPVREWLKGYHDELQAKYKSEIFEKAWTLLIRYDIEEDFLPEKED